MAIWAYVQCIESQYRQSEVKRYEVRRMKRVSPVALFTLSLQHRQRHRPHPRHVHVGRSVRGDYGWRWFCRQNKTQQWELDTTPQSMPSKWCAKTGKHRLLQYTCKRAKSARDHPNTLTHKDSIDQGYSHQRAPCPAITDRFPAACAWRMLVSWIDEQLCVSLSAVREVMQLSD